ncbi:MAG: AMP-binding protein [Eubacteriales bacterium]|nr:AMP-binding protein [Eubacteriales bacterium]
MDFISTKKIEENFRRILQAPRYQSHPSGPELYKSEFYSFKDAKNFRELLRQGTSQNPDGPAFLLKEPRAFGQETSFDKRNLPLRLPEYKPLSYRQYEADVKALATAIYAMTPAGELAPFESYPSEGSKIKSAVKSVAICGESRYEWYLSYLAIGQGPATIVPLDRELPLDELLNCLQRANCDTILLSGDLLPKLSAKLDELPAVQRLICFDQTGLDELYFWDLLEAGRQLYQEKPFVDSLEIDEDALSVLLFTSGTTSKSKAVKLSQANILSNLNATLKLYQVTAQDCFLSVLPLHHTYECTCGFLAPIYSGACIAISEGLRYIPKNIKEVEPTIMLIVPLMLETFYNRLIKTVQTSLAKTHGFRLILKLSRLTQLVGADQSQRLFKKVHEAFPGIKSFIVGGAAVDSQLIANWRALGFNCLQGYGLTESAPIIALNPDYNPKDKAAGLPLPGTELRIINPDENGVGEVIARSDSIMLGYLDDPERTAEAIDEEGFLHTGDLGYLDEDYYLVLTGRKANLIVSKNGKNIFPEEIEFMLKQYPLIEEAVVRMGRDDRGGEQLIAEIYPSRQFMDDDPELYSLAFDHPLVNDRCMQIIKQVNNKLVSYKHLRSAFIRTTPFPMTSSRKVKRNQQS